MAFIFPPAAPRAVLCIGSCKGAHKTPAFWLLLSSAGTASALSLHHLPLTSRAEVGRILGGDIISTADPLTRGYSIPCDACWDTEAKEKEEGGGIFVVYSVYPPEQPLCVLKPCLLGSGKTSLADGKYTIKSLVFFLCFCAHILFFFCFSNLPSPDLQGLFPILFCWGGKWWSDLVGTWHPAKVNPLQFAITF